MSEAEFGEILEALEGLKDGDEGGLFSAIEGATSEAEASDSWGKWKKSEASQSFNKFKSNFFDEFTDVKSDGKGGWDIENPKTNEKFNTKDLKNDLTGKYGAETSPPNYKGAFEKMGIDPKVMEQSGFKDFENKQTEGWKQTKTVKEVDSVNNSKSTGNNIADGGGGKPLNASDMEEGAKKTGKFGKLSDVIKKIGEVGYKGGKWIAFIAVAGGLAYGAEQLYEDIKKHQSAMNGCWYINTISGDKCKIAPLTCDKDYRDSPDITKCTMCDDIKNCSKSASASSSLAFNPALAGSTPKDASKNFPGKYTDDQSIACDNCYSCATTTACTSTTSCASGVGGCDVSQYNVPSGYTMKCVNVDFWGAADDLIKEGLGTVDNLMKKILNIIIYVIIGIVVLVVGFMIIKFFIGLAKRSKSEPSRGLEYHQEVGGVSPRGLEYHQDVGGIPYLE